MLAVYFTDMKHIAGLCVAPCKDVPVLQNGSGRQKFTLPLFLLEIQNSRPWNELMVRQTLQEQEMVAFYNHLMKRLNTSIIKHKRKDKSMLEVNVLNAKLVTGDKNKKDSNWSLFSKH